MNCHSPLKLAPQETVSLDGKAKKIILYGSYVKNSVRNPGISVTFISRFPHIFGDNFGNFFREAMKTGGGGGFPHVHV